MRSNTPEKGTVESAENLQKVLTRTAKLGPRRLRFANLPRATLSGTPQLSMGRDHMRILTGETLSPCFIELRGDVLCVHKGEPKEGKEPEMVEVRRRPRAAHTALCQRGAQSAAPPHLYARPRSSRWSSASAWRRRATRGAARPRSSRRCGRAVGAQGSARPPLRALSGAAPDPRAQAVALAKYQVLAVYSAAGASWFKFESAAERLAWETAINERLLATEGKESQEEKAAAFKKLQPMLWDQLASQANRFHTFAGEGWNQAMLGDESHIHGDESLNAWAHVERSIERCALPPHSAPPIAYSPPLTSASTAAIPAAASTRSPPSGCTAACATRSSRCTPTASRRRSSTSSTSSTRRCASRSSGASCS